MPDMPNWAWHEYGNRVGFWHLLEVFDSSLIPATLAINGSAIAACEAITRAARDRNWEFMGPRADAGEHAKRWRTRLSTSRARPS
jgi:peptidoglycan/xylan/chitin deacetylase (PgdA/CDA1 family)